MKEKLLAKLVEKYPGLSKKFLGLWADKLQSKVTEESQIEEVVNGLDNLPVPLTDLATEFQKEGDSRVTEAEKKWKQKNPTTPATPKTDDPPADDTPGWAKALINEVNTLKKEKTLSSIQQKVSGHEKLKNIPAVFYKGRSLPEKEEDIDSFVAEIESDFTAFDQERVNSGLASSSKPATGGTKNEAAITDAEILSWAGKDKK